MKFCTLVLMCVVFSSPNQAKSIRKNAAKSLNDAASSYFIFEPDGRGSYAFGYEVDDPGTQNKQFRDEERKSDGTVTGKYGWVSDDGLVYIVSYVADRFGYRSKIDTIPVWKLIQKGLNIRLI